MNATQEIVETPLSVVEPSRVTITPMDMLNQAIAKNADIQLLEKLMSLHERWEANQAKKAFDAAVAASKAQIPPIARNAEGHNKKKYADFGAIAKVIDPILGEHGLSYRFRTSQTDKISVTCILSHRDGHAEETTLSGPADNSGNKNAIQSIGSTLTYLQRYSLVQMLGLAAAQDDDGKAAVNADNSFITEEQERTLREALVFTNGDEAKFCERVGVPSLADIYASKFADAMKIIQQRKAKQ